MSPFPVCSSAPARSFVRRPARWLAGQLPATGHDRRSKPPKVPTLSAQHGAGFESSLFARVGGTPLSTGLRLDRAASTLAFSFGFATCDHALEKRQIYQAQCLANFATGTSGTFVEAVPADPARMQRFAGAIAFLQSTPEQHLDYLVDNLEWPRDAGYHLIGIGGSQGSASIALLRAFPNLRATVQDFAAVVAAAQVPLDLEDRLRFAAHNMFTEQLIRDADVYLLRCTLHNWADEHAAVILKALLPALRPGTKLILNEMCLPSPGKASKLQEQQMRGYDISMKQILNGKERDADGWSALVQTVHRNLRLVSIKTPPGSILSIIECQYTQDQNS